MNRRAFLSLLGTTVASTAMFGAGMVQPAWAGMTLESAAGFGVRPDAATDQTVAFSAMLHRAAAKGSAVALEPGVYRLGRVTVPDGTVLVGVAGQTRLVQTVPGPMLEARDANRVILLNLDIEGAVAPWPADDSVGVIDMRAVGFTSITDCVISGAASDAIRLERGGGSITGCTINRANQFGVFIVESTGVNVSDNTVSHCGNGGVIIHRWSMGNDNSTVTGNTISDIRADNGGTGQWGNGVNIFQTAGNAISNNVIRDCAFSAIRANTARDFQYVGNTCLRSGETALYAEFGFHNAFISQNTVDGAANGIAVTNLDHGGYGAVVSRNTVRNLSLTAPIEGMSPGYGTGISVEADTKVVGNLVENAPHFGINAGWGPHLRNVVVSSNTIRRAEFGIGVSAAPGAGTAAIHANVISARSGAIIAHAWEEHLGGDLSRPGSDIPANVRLTENRTG